GSVRARPQQVAAAERAFAVKGVAHTVRVPKDIRAPPGGASPKSPLGLRGWTLRRLPRDQRLESPDLLLRRFQDLGILGVRRDAAERGEGAGEIVPVGERDRIVV